MKGKEKIAQAHNCQLFQNVSFEAILGEVVLTVKKKKKIQLCSHIY